MTPATFGRRALVIAIAVATLASAGIVAQQPANPANPATATIAGTLVTDESSPRPVRRAVLRLAGVGATPRLTTSDDDGRFVFAKLPAGRYSLSATRAGYVATFYGSRHPGRGPGAPIVVGDGARVDVTLKVPHGAAMTGVVTDEQGQPVGNLLVQVIDAETRMAAPAAPSGLPNQLLPDSPPMSAVTDDRGVYRIFGLPPGTYLVAAVPRLNSNLVDEMSATMVTDEQVRWAQTQAAAAAGRLAAPSPAPPAGRSVTYAPVYFPGIADIAAAQTVTVGMGEERSGISFPLRLVASATIDGTLVDAAGQAVPSVAAILVRKPGPRSALVSWLPPSDLTNPRARISAGEFAFEKVTPGDYVLVARTGGGTRGRGGQPGPLTLWSISDVSVQGEDQHGLVVRLSPGTRVSGSVVFEATSLRAPTDLSTLSITLAPVVGLPGIPVPSALMAPDGTFSFQSVAPALSNLRIATPGPSAPAPHWMLKSAIANGHDVTDAPLDLTNVDEVTGLTITFTDRTTEISGKVIGAEGTTTAAYSAVVFPADRALWVPGSRRIKAIPLATNGTFSIPDVPPGRYALAVVDDLDPADLLSPDFLSQLQAAAATITLADGEHKTQDLRIGK